MGIYLQNKVLNKKPKTNEPKQTNKKRKKPTNKHTHTKKKQQHQNQNKTQIRRRSLTSESIVA